MKLVSCWNDLVPLGIDALTAESCGFSWRLLCDCDERGRKALARLFGIPSLKLGEAWNRGTAEKPHVGSVMLTPDMLNPVGVFALLESGCTEVWLTRNGTLLGIEQDDIPEALTYHREFVVRIFKPSGTAGDRNRHVFSQRVT